MTVKKHNDICKYNNLPTTCFGLIRPSSGWNTDGRIRPKHVVGKLLYLQISLCF